MSKLPLTDPLQAGVFYLPTGHAAALRRQGNSAHLVILSAELGQANSFEAALEELGVAFEFPDWYGGNFDALFDCLLDPDWKPAPGHLLFLNGCAHLRHLNPDNFSTLQEVLLAAAESKRAMKQPLWILLDTPTGGIPCFPGS